MNILVVDDEQVAAEALGSFLRRRGHEATIAENGAVAWRLVADRPFDLILADVRMPEMDGLELNRRLARERPEIIVVLITAYASVPSAVEALRAGAFDYLTKPVDPDELACLIERIGELVDLRREADLLRQQVQGPDRVGDLIGRDRAMLEACRTVRTAARSTLAVLITGETGTGKTLAARAIHKLSPRGEGPFVEVNCAAIPATLLESELFGHVRGAFTGAVREREGKLRVAHRGTILLDEIGCLDGPGQAKLLQVLESPMVVPVGADRGVAVDVRLIAATNDDLEARVEAGTFRQDLFYRLKVLHLHMPSLCERRADIPLLIEHLLGSAAAGRGIALSPGLMQLMLHHRWPGNVRELRNTLEVMLAALTEGTELQVRHAPPTLRALARPEQLATAATLEEMLGVYERFLISERLRIGGGHLGNVAEGLGVSLRTLERRMAYHGLRRRDFRLEPAGHDDPD